MASKSNGKSRAGEEIFGVVLLALAVLAFLALIKNNPNDPSRNLIGSFGAFLSAGMVGLLGIFFSYCIPVAMAVWGVVMVRGGDLKKTGVRTGYLLAFVTLFCTLLSITFDIQSSQHRRDAADLVAPPAGGRVSGLPPVIPAQEVAAKTGKNPHPVMGGYVGLLTGNFLKDYFNTVGAYIVSCTLLLILSVMAAAISMKTILDKLHEWLGAAAVSGKAWASAWWKEYQKRRKLKKEIGKRAKPPVVRDNKENADDAEGDEPTDEEAAEPVEPVITSRPDAPKQPAKPVKDKEKKENRAGDASNYQLPSIDLLVEATGAEGKESKEELLANADKLKNALNDFGVEVDVMAVNPGPVITQYEVSPQPGVKISQIVSLTDDLALNMKARGVRIEAPIPGKGTVGIELPNKYPETVFMRDVITSEIFQKSKSLLTLGLGRNVAGEIVCERMDKMPHLLVAGATGSGKSVCINTIICSLVYRATPWDLRFIMIDPKRVELSMYKEIPHLLFPVVTEPRDAAAVLDWMINEMEERYKKLQAMSVRDLDGYNTKLKGMSDQQKVETFGEEDAPKIKHLPYIVLIVDEFADIMMATDGKVEEPITRLAQKARAVGFHLLLATQRPSVNVITGVIKANFPSRIAFKVAQRNDSRTILDANGAESLLGRGDMLYISTAHPKAVRYHGAFISDTEAEKIANHLRKQPKPDYEPDKTLDDFKEEADMAAAANGTGGGIGGAVGRDPLFNEAARLVITHQQGSVSLVQRRLSLGYSRAARVIDQLADAGVVGPFDGSKARQVLLDESHLEDFPVVKKPDAV